MSDPMIAPTEKAAVKRVIMVADDAERRRLIDEHPQAALVSETLPLRANLSVLENITVVLQYRTNTYVGEADDVAWELLKLLRRDACAEKRDPDLTYEERFVTKLLRAVVLKPALILIDRPAQLLPDTHYPFFLNDTLHALHAHFERCWIIDYTWNKPLYANRE